MDYPTHYYANHNHITGQILLFLTYSEAHAYTKNHHPKGWREYTIQRVTPVFYNEKEDILEL